MLSTFVPSLPNKMFKLLSKFLSAVIHCDPQLHHFVIFPIRVNSFSHFDGELKVFQNHRVEGGWHFSLDIGGS